MKKILVPVDFSDASINALEYALEIAKRNQSSITLLHVCSPPYADPAIDAISTSQFLQSILENANEQIDKLITNYASATIAISKHVLVGSLTSFMQEEEGVDLIVMGTTGASDTINKYIGSNTLSVINSSSIPLIVVPKQLKYQVSKVIYATQLEFEEFDSINRAMQFCNHLNASMDFIHIETDGELDIVSDSAIIAKMKEKFGEHILIHFYNHNNVIKGLNEFIDEHHYDLLIVAHRDRNFITRFIDPGNTKSIALYSHAPVLFFHLKY